ncbi:hypothetical protein E2320_002861, partial [Naja naja]
MPHSTTMGNLLAVMKRREATMDHVFLEPEDKHHICIQDSDPIWRYSRVAIAIMILLVPFYFYCWTKKS